MYKHKKNSAWAANVEYICSTLVCAYSMTLIFISGVISVSIYCFYRTCVILSDDSFHPHRNGSLEQCDPLVLCSKSVLKVLQCSLVFQSDS